MKSIRYATFIAVPICLALSAQVSADVFTVNSTDDPATGDAANCGAGLPGCTFRDALAAADATPAMDTIVFDLSGKIYLLKALTATQPVTIDGGGTTVVRVNQGYGIAVLPDRHAFDENESPIQVLQPSYFSTGSPPNAMLDLQGAGSVVQGLTLDGSITPDPADLGVARIDFDSSGTTDYILYTIDTGGPHDGARWPIAGGISVTGNATVSGNSLSNLNNNGISVTFGQYAVIAGNDISGGNAADAVDKGFAADGITFYGSVFSSVSGNTVTGFRTGVNFTYSSNLDIDGNQASGNVVGLTLDSLDDSYGPVTVENNVLSNNLKAGLTTYQVSGPQISQNEMNSNGSLGIHVKTSGNMAILGNQVKDNGSGEHEDGGILINEQSGAVSLASNTVSANTGFGVVIAESSANNVSDNELSRNAGAGLVLFNGSQYNQVTSNQVKRNYVGIDAGDPNDGNFPSDNTYQNNTVLQNQAADAVDFDLNCNDTWSGNTIGTSYSASGSCIDQ